MVDTSTYKVIIGNNSDIINGYIITMEEKGSLFTTEDVGLIFGNLREIHTFQEQFLEQLETAFRHGKKNFILFLVLETMNF